MPGEVASAEALAKADDGEVREAEAISLPRLTTSMSKTRVPIDGDFLKYGISLFRK
jgi:hypothetical protein